MQMLTAGRRVDNAEPLASVAPNHVLYFRPGQPQVLHEPDEAVAEEVRLCRQRGGIEGGTLSSDKEEKEGNIN